MGIKWEIKSWEFRGNKSIYDFWFDAVSIFILNLLNPSSLKSIIKERALPSICFIGGIADPYCQFSGG